MPGKPGKHNYPAERAKVLKGNAKRLQHETALRLRRGGMSWSAMAHSMGLKSHLQARLVYERALKEAVGEETRTVLIATESDRLDSYLQALSPGILEGDPKAITAAVTISQRRANMLGLDAPKKSELELLHTPKFVAFRDAVMAVVARHPHVAEELKAALGRLAEDQAGPLRLIGMGVVREEEARAMIDATDGEEVLRDDEDDEDGKGDPGDDEDQ
jgi:hypothetical protein